MVKFPFQLKIKRFESGGQAESLTCQRLLRDIPGRRRAFEAQWNGRGVIVKVFCDRLSSKRHVMREWNGMTLLRDRGFNSPEPLFYGQTGDNAWAVVMEKITDSSTALEVFEKTTDKTGRTELLSKICSRLARLHSKGVVQKDLHLKNFLFKGDELFLLDAGQILFFPRPISRKLSARQLAILLSQYCSRDADLVRTLSGFYFSARGWSFENPDKIRLRKYMNSHTAKNVKRGLKKSLRTSGKYLKVHRGRYTAVFDRSFCGETEGVDLLGRIDALIAAGEMLKDGNTCCVSRITFNGKDMVVKRYNHKGFVHSLRHTIKKSRARLGWLNSHRLRMLDISTPKALSYVEERKFFIIWRSYLLTKYIAGQSFYDFLNDRNINDKMRLEITRRVENLFDKMAQNFIIHGDLKHSNILVNSELPMLIDLDGMKIYRWNWTYKLRSAKDRTRFRAT